MRNKIRFPLIFLLVLAAVFLGSTAFAQGTVPSVSFELNGSNNPRELSNSIELLVLFTVLTLLPSILIMMTSFTRVVVILSFLKNAMGTQQTIPSQVMIGLALFITFFIMSPVGKEVYQEALQPYYENEIGQAEAIEKGMKPIREFMMRQTREKDVALFMDMSGEVRSAKDEMIKLEQIPNTVLIPAFIISELKTGFQVGFLLFLPFIVIDMVVASTLMSMGMMMLPPMMISLPFKILLFILVDGWNLVIRSIVTGFN
ncbi:MAG: flagellar type III secretion system pore protein FliP [Peptostreptococcaceae bacterium]|nr:flagellar type III secretion system pore protein FliP [Peptostreptococcaceae bacterium]